MFGFKGELSIKEKQEIDKSLIKMIVQDFQPLSVVENSGFLEHSRNLHLLYEPPSRKHLSSVLLPDLYNETRTKLKDILNIQHMSIDSWSLDSCKSYVTITCHFIYENKLIRRVLSTAK